LAELDPLTGILNRGALMVLLEKFAEEATSSGRPFSVFLFDIDHFKNYNETNGHLPGDDCLRLLARLVSEETRADNAFGRYGGEEFLLLLPGRSGREAQFLAEKIRCLIADYPCPHGDRQPLGAITVSGGVACLPDSARTIDDVLAIADQAPYNAETAGRNCVMLAEPSQAETVAAELPPLPDYGDDLRQIRGIGTRYVAALEEIGIFSFRQIADLDWRDISRLAAHLQTSPERIVRDKWLHRAQSLYRDKYGEDLEETA
jgi:diguanylate cyclase (GGDEF)-like protein